MNSSIILNVDQLNNNIISLNSKFEFNKWNSMGRQINDQNKFNLFNDIKISCMHLTNNYKILVCEESTNTILVISSTCGLKHCERQCF